MNDIRLTVPAKPVHLHLLRSVVAGAASRRDLSIDSLEDLQLAVDEAAAYLLGRGLDATLLYLTIRLADDRVEAWISVDAEAATWPIEGATSSLAWTVLSGLSDERSFELSEGRPSIRVVKYYDAPMASGRATK